MEELTIKDFVTAGNFASFDSFRAGVLYYTIAHRKTVEQYQFQVPIEDTNGATFKSLEKSLTLIRWIRKGLEDKTMVKIPK